LSTIGSVAASREGEIFIRKDTSVLPRTAIKGVGLPPEKGIHSMKTTIKNSIHRLIVTLLVLPCFLLLSAAQGTDLGSVVPGANTADGSGVLVNRTTGVWNTGLGFQALYHDTSGNLNTATGLRALFNNIDGSGNVANGVQALFSNTSGYGNTADGVQTLYNNTTGFNNIAIGMQTLFGNTTGGYNIAIGYQTLFGNNIGDSNIAIGFRALYNNSSGVANIALGNGAGQNLTTGNSNIDIGNPGVAAESHTIRIGTAGTHTATYIAGISGAVASGGSAVYVNSAGKLGTSLSSRRFKDEIKPMDTTSEAILALKPVTFRYKKDLDPTGIPQFGLVAEDVEQVNPDLVVRDAKGNVESVRYEAVNAMLLNEFLKEHRKVAEREATITQLHKGLETAIMRLEEQEARIEKLRAELERRQPASQTVAIISKSGAERR
jgi:hypothetical protein